MKKFDVVLLASSNPLGMELVCLSSHSSEQAAHRSAKQQAKLLADKGAYFQTVAVFEYEGDPKYEDWELVKSQIVNRPETK